MTARSMPCDTWPAGASMARVSVCRAACGRRCGRASPALQNLPLHGTKQNTRPTTTRPRTIAELNALTFLQTAGRLRTRKPFIHAVVAVPSVVAVQKAPPRSQRPARSPAKPARRLFAGAWGTPRGIRFFWGIFEMRVMLTASKR